MRSCSVSSYVIEKLWSENKVTTSDETEEIQINDGEVEDGFQVVSRGGSGLPVIWTWDVLADVFLDCGMHLVFHGVVANIVEVAHQFMTDHKLGSEFIKIVTPYMSDIMTLRLDWCHMKLFPKKQWVAEDELGLARILPFIYGQFFLNLADKMKDSNTTSKTLHALAQVFHSLHVMVCILMTPKDSSEKLIDAHVKVFLSCCNRFVRSYQGKEKVPFWSTKGNYLSLLNLADQVEEFGSLRWYWDGTRERYIQTVKKDLVAMRRSTSYFNTKMIQIQKRVVMKWFKRLFHIGDKTEKKTYNNNYFRYESLEEIERKVEVGEVISGFTLESTGDDTWVAFGDNGKKVNIVRINKLTKMPKRRECGFMYMRCEIGPQVDNPNMTVDGLEMIMVRYCLFLPFVYNKEDSFGREFAIIYDDWEVCNDLGYREIPHLCETLFRNNVLDETALDATCLR